jgi:hypothetical protein
VREAVQQRIRAVEQRAEGEHAVMAEALADARQLCGKEEHDQIKDAIAQTDRAV